MRKYPILIIIVVLAAVLRLGWLAEHPPSLNWDEVSHGYNAYSILKTGKDEWGMSFPLANFRAYGDYPLPLNLYITIPFIFIFGLSEFAIRLPHALLGILTAIASYFLVFGITKENKKSLFAAFLVAISPWYAFTSRFVLQSNLAVFFVIAAMAAFFNREKHKILFPLTFLFFGLALYSYHTTRIFVPLLLVPLIIIYKKDFTALIKKRSKISVITFVIFAIFFLPLPFILSNPEARARSKEVFIVDEGAVAEIVQKRQTSGLPDIVNRLVYNRPLYFIKEFSKNYVGYFSPSFLYLKGGTQYQFSVQGKGLLYLINLPFFYIGIYLVGSKALKRDKKYQLILAWFLLAPIPASLTTEKFAVIRATTILPLPTLFEVLGIYYVWNLLKSKRKQTSKILIWAYFIILIFSMENYLIESVQNYRSKYSWSWQYGYKEVVNYAKENYDKYDKIIVTKRYGEPHEFFLFFWPWDPEVYRNDPNLNRFYQSNWYWVDSFDKFFFVNDWQINEEETHNFVFTLESGGEVDCQNSKCLLITSPNNKPDDWLKLKTINFLNNEKAFEILEN